MNLKSMMIDNNFIDRKHKSVILNLLQNMTFSELCRESIIDSIIKKCWYDEYRTIVELIRLHDCRWLFIISRAIKHRHIYWELLWTWDVTFKRMLLFWRESLSQLFIRIPSVLLALWSWKAVCLCEVKLHLLIILNQCSNNLFFCKLI